MVSAIILAGGKGKRMGKDISKQFILVKDKPIIYYTIKKFSDCKLIDEIILVLPKDEIEYCKKEVLEKYSLKVDKIIAGGKERQDSVYNGLKALKNSDIVLIHDGARPYVSKQSINDLVECLKTYDAGLLMVPCKDTIKEVKEGIVVKTLKRETLMQAQTPQVFKSEDIKVAYQKAKDEGYVATDDSQLFERYIDKDIKAVLGDYSNLKITTQEDLK